MAQVEDLIKGAHVWVLGSGPTLDLVPDDRLRPAVMIPNSVIHYINAPGSVIWCAVDRSEMRRHDRMPACSAAILGHYAYTEAQRLGWLDQGKTTHAKRGGAIQIKPGTVALQASACALYGASSVTFAGFGGEGFAKKLGPPYSLREWGPVEKTYFPTQIQTAQHLLDQAGVPWEQI